MRPSGQRAELEGTAPPPVSGYACDCANWLQERLEGGPCRVAELRADGAESGFSVRALEGAKAAIGAVSIRAGRGSMWCWALPKTELPEAVGYLPEAVRGAPAHGVRKPVADPAPVASMLAPGAPSRTVVELQTRDHPGVWQAVDVPAGEPLDLFRERLRIKLGGRFLGLRMRQVRP